MEQTIASNPPRDDNPIVALVNWSIPWTLSLAGELFLYSALSLAWSIYQGTWQFPVSFASALCAWALFRYALSAKIYVSSEQDKDLAQTMICLSRFWSCSFLSVIVALTAYVFGDVFLLNRSFGLGVSGFCTVLFFALWRWESNVPHCESFVKYLPLFAQRNLSKTKYLFGLNLLMAALLFYSAVSGWPEGILTRQISITTQGLVYLVSGIATGFVWWKIRDIRRNAALIYFERALARLGGYWFFATLFVAVQTVTLFF